MNIFNPKLVLSLANEPEDSDEFNWWVQQQDIFPFLEHEILDEHIILYASLPHVFINSVLIPGVVLDDSSIQDLLKWQHSPNSLWSHVCSSDEIWIESPLSNAGSELLSKGEQIIFERSFDGDKSKHQYYEIEQKITHILDIHFMLERNSWCKLDRFGDIEDIVKITRNETGILISMQKQALGYYASLSGTKLLRMFDFTRYKSKSFWGWNGDNESLLQKSDAIFSRLVVYPGYGSYSRGIQVADIRIPQEEIIRQFWGEPVTDSEKKYATYIAHDWKNKVVKEISCNPSCLANYFTESNIPFEITPAFFRPEVLSKYKSDREKYQLESNSISCRGAWYLKTFDINEAGQVHTYLIYLSQLPYEEQLHWKQYNEKPKSPLSERAIKRDFEGQFYQKYDPLPSLKHKLYKLDRLNVQWWKLRDRNAPNKVHYPYTASKDEWAEEILNLDQLLVEGFEEKWLRNKVKNLGRNPEAKFRSLKLIEECLIGVNFDEDHARQITSSFHKIHDLRSKLKGHTSGQEAENIRKASLANFGSFYKHFEHICSECDESLEIVIEAFKDFN
ncbi:hypothetical protein BMF77_00120 [Dolichospermum sp. UHCC 0315A]|jgi:hypothetical protein|uniref:hypothetical protein n=1 Tax=Dolichospermum sp. UHCC 0315A TaxID=1914871 RepID=UPI0011E6A4F2|nr:hypothetical protein [Dolichospermum sp. UHCC 0315A]QEI39569.1 hypothetical protein BMF77_00120 [Dolichospermum sp. UHCC 0315A]